MKKIILYIAVSIDGRIAEPDGGTDFLSEYPVTEEMNYGYKEFMDSIDTIIMGGRTYRELDTMDAMGAYKDKSVYVVSHYDWHGEDNVHFIMGNIADRITSLRNESGKDIWLFGGGELVSMLLAAGLVDEMRLFFVPTILGKGIPLFPEQPTGSKWTLTGSASYPNGVLGVTYTRQ